MKISEKLYVGLQRDRYQRAEEPRILGFAIPYDTTKTPMPRQATVDNWRQKDIDPRIIDNIPQKFFKVVDSVERCSTSNKLFRILDPRGFELEISAENLLRVLQDCTASKGTILEECVWTHLKGGRLYLLPVDSQEYKLHTETSKKGAFTQKPGGFYISESNGFSIFRYEGIFHHTYVDWEANSIKETIDPSSINSRPFYHNSQIYNISEYSVDAEILINSGKKPSYVYTEFRLDSHGNVEKSYVNIRKSLMKLTAEYTGDVFDEMKEAFDPMQFINYVQYSHRYADREYESGNLSTEPRGDFIGLFASKEDALAFDYEPIIKTIKPNPNYVKGKTRGDRYYGYGSSIHVTNPTPTVYNIEDKRK